MKLQQSPTASGRSQGHSPRHAFTLAGRQSWLLVFSNLVVGFQEFGCWFSGIWFLGFSNLVVGFSYISSSMWGQALWMESARCFQTSLGLVLLTWWLTSNNVFDWLIYHVLIRKLLYIWWLCSEQFMDVSIFRNFLVQQCQFQTWPKYLWTKQVPFCSFSLCLMFRDEWVVCIWCGDDFTCNHFIWSCRGLSYWGIVGPDRIGDLEWLVSHFGSWIEQFIWLAWRLLESLNFAIVVGTVGTLGYYFFLAWYFGTSGVLSFCLLSLM